MTDAPDVHFGDGPVAARVLPDGRRAEVLPLLFGGGRLGVGPADGVNDGGYQDVWDYEHLAAAVAALAYWGGEGEPAGWTRHPETGRRRPGGDPAKEYQRW